MGFHILQWGPYKWKTYKEAYQETLLLGSALRAHGIEPVRGCIPVTHCMQVFWLFVLLSIKISPAIHPVQALVKFATIFIEFACTKISSSVEVYARICPHSHYIYASVGGREICVLLISGDEM